MLKEQSTSKIRAIWQHAENAAKKILDISINGQEKFSGGNAFRKWFYQYVFLNVILARPSFSVVCSREQLSQLKKLNVPESVIIGMIASQFLADHSLPNLYIAGAFSLISQIPELPLSVSGPASWAAGRIGWGVTAGLVHATSYALTKPEPDLDDFWQSTNEPNFTDVSPELPWPLEFFNQSINLNK